MKFTKRKCQDLPLWRNNAMSIPWKESAGKTWGILKIIKLGSKGRPRRDLLNVYGKQ